jgi:1-acyl-sn-glycerol-3-phosphate acyltransferase
VYFARKAMAYWWSRLPGFRDVDSLDNRDPRLICAAARALRPILWRWFSPEVRGLDRIPEGRALYVGNHSGGFVSPDTWIFAAAVLEERGVEHVPYGLGHQVVMEAPVLNQVLTRIGGVEADPDNAHRILARGGKVLVYPGGDLDAFRPTRDSHRVVFGPRRGYLRLALREAVPLVPVVAAGGHDGWIVLSDGKWLARRLHTHRLLRTDVLPITLSLPWGLAIGAPPYVPWPTKIMIEVLDPICFERRGEDAAGDDEYVEQCHRRVLSEMQAALDRLTRERRDRR